MSLLHYLVAVAVAVQVETQPTLAVLAEQQLLQEPIQHLVVLAEQHKAVTKVVLAILQEPIQDLVVKVQQETMVETALEPLKQVNGE
jgi:hypothetical protein